MTKSSVYFPKIVSEVRKVFKDTKVKNFHISKRKTISKSNTNGHTSTIGIVWGLGIELQVWYDTFSGSTNKRLYFGVYSKQVEKIVSVIRNCKDTWGDPIRLTDKNVALREDGQNQRLAKRLTNNEYGYPIFEKYSDPSTYRCYLGIFEPNEVKLSDAGKFGNRIESFLYTITNSGRTSDRLIYAAIENRQIVADHIRRERDGILPELCKQRDQYRCQACKLSFSSRFGDKWKRCVETHHLKPLAQSKNRVKTQLKDLVTLCPNCHTMIHTMLGKVGDMKMLSKIVSK